MDVSVVKNHIKTKQFNDFYLFTGTEWAVQKIYIDQIAKVSGKELCYIDSIADVWSQIVNTSLIKKQKCFVVRDDHAFMTDEKLQDKIDSGVLGHNMLIELLSSTDKRTKLYKRYKDSIVDFEPLKTQILKKYILKEIKLSDKNCEILMDVCENDYGRCLLEIDKIKTYVQSMDRSFCVNTEDEAFQYLLDDGTIYEPPYDALFDFVDAVLKGQINRSFDLLNQSYAVGEATMVLLSVLYDNAKAVLQTQTYHGNNLAQATGLSGWQIKNAKTRLNYYSDRELINLLKLIQKCESGIKTGKIDDKVAIEWLLVSVI